jgi:hypothetical protein
MKKAITALAAAALLATAGPASAADPVTYKGKTSSGHPITIKVKKGIIRYWRAGVRTACIPIQGGGRPLGGPEFFGFDSTVMKFKKRHSHFSDEAKPGFHYREVTIRYDIWLKRAGDKLSGRMRTQYQFMIPKYPIGTFSIYSCLGGATFKAKTVR